MHVTTAPTASAHDRPPMGSPTGRVTFSPRQQEVVALLACGLSNDEIAARLDVSTRTVRAHCDILREKLGVRRQEIPFAYRRLTGDDPLGWLENGAGG